MNGKRKKLTLKVTAVTSSKNYSDFIFEEYNGHVIASHRNNKAERDINNLIIVCRLEDLMEHGVIIGLDDSKQSGSKVSVPNNMEDAKAYVDSVARPRQQNSIGQKQRELPSIKIKGTEFLVDVNRLELREKADERNVIEFQYLDEARIGYQFRYSPKLKNIADIFEYGSVKVHIPEFVVLDPVGMALKHNLSFEELKGKTDFDLMVDQKAFDMRVNKGVLPTVDIAGHMFYVDIRMDKLRPKDDFLSNGIVFDDIDHHLSYKTNSYVIPYNPRTREFQELDYDSILKFPKGLIAVEIPFKRVLDPIGCNRNGGWDLKYDLKHIGLQLHFDTKIIPWEKTFLAEAIQENIEKKKEHQKRNPPVKAVKRKPNKGKGYKM